MSIGIYKYTNTLNDKIYIGQSTNIEKRQQQHLYDAYQRNGTRHTTGVDAAIKKYGIENFTFEILQYCLPEQLDELEIYWINYYDSYHNGYNMTVGGKALRGEDHPRAILTEQEVWDIREQYGQKVLRRVVFAPYLEKGVTERCLKKVWDCETWPTIHTDVYTEENRAWHKKHVGHSEDQIGLSSLDRAITQWEIDEWVEKYKEGMSINAIAKLYERDNGTVKKYIDNPKAVKKIKYHGRTIKNVETDKVFNSISSAAKWAGCGATTLTRHLASDGAAGKIPETEQVAHWIELT